jgi:LemA protein
MRRLLSILSLCTALLLGGCGYNTLQVTDETIKSSWSEVITQY